MEKKDFKENTRCTLTAKIDGKLRPTNVYILKLFKENMIVRLTDKEGILRKMAYDDVSKIVASHDVSEQNHYSAPEAVLLEKHWQDRVEMQHYGTASHMGK